MDGTLEPTSRVLEALSVFGASASKQVYKQSRLECNRRVIFFCATMVLPFIILSVPGWPQGCYSYIAYDVRGRSGVTFIKN